MYIFYCRSCHFTFYFDNPSRIVWTRAILTLWKKYLTMLFSKVLFYHQGQRITTKYPFAASWICKALFFLLVCSCKENRQAPNYFLKQFCVSFETTIEKVAPLISWYGWAVFHTCIKPMFLDESNPGVVECSVYSCWCPLRNFSNPLQNRNKRRTWSFRQT